MDMAKITQQLDIKVSAVCEKDHTGHGRQHRNRKRTLSSASLCIYHRALVSAYERPPDIWRHGTHPKCMWATL